MGEVQKQSVNNSIIQYAGIVLGYFSSVFLFTEILDAEQYGLTRVLFAIAGIYVNLSSIGAFKVIIRFFPFFKSDDKRHKGFLLFNGILVLVGFVLTTLIYLLLRQPISSQYSSATSLFFDHYNWVIWLSFLMLYTNLLEGFLMALKKTVLTYFLKNIFIRLIWILEILIFHAGLIDFDQFLFIYLSSYILNFGVMLVYLWKLGELKWSLEFFNQRKRILKVVTNYGLFTIVSGLSAMLVNRIDIIMITFLLGLSSTSIYQIAFYISSVIYVPSQAIYRISMPVVAELWKQKKMKEMELLYQKSCLNQLLSGGFVFLIIWCNIDDLFHMLKPIYSEGKWVVLLLSLSVLFNMLTGINQVIIVITKYFRYDTYASIALGILTVVTNIIFIPILGLEGAALATMLSVVLYHTFKFFLIKVKLKMVAFTSKTIWAMLLLLFTYIVSVLLPVPFENFVLNMIFRSLILSVIYFTTLYVTGISEDIKSVMKSYLDLMKKRK
ncbi:MAG: polysaccharide biosynthesis C-terminal domain-containing protein [Vicingaceae bacterium]